MSNIVWEFVTLPVMPPLKFTKVSDKKKKTSSLFLAVVPTKI